MNIPTNLRYTADHEWAKLDGELITVGITDFAQGELGDIVYVEIETLNQHIESHTVFGTVEAVKAVSELFMPIAGTIVAINEQLQNTPELVNSDPYNEGWMIIIKPDNLADWDTLLDAEKYAQLL
jgi:glycine cleavage system H protein